MISQRNASKTSPKYPQSVGAIPDGLLSNPHIEYERMKRQWQIENPGCTPAEYENAIRLIAGECGV